MQTCIVSGTIPSLLQGQTLKVIIISAQPGAGLKVMSESVRKLAQEKKCNCSHFALDDLVIQKLQERHRGEFQPQRLNYYQMPEHIVQECSGQALHELSAELKTAADENREVAFLYMHTQYSNPEKSTFYSAVSAHEVREIVGEFKVVVANVQQDVYETRQRLIDPYFLRESSEWRNPTADYTELERVLSWRLADFYASKAMAFELGCPFYLFHAKSPVQVLWQICVEGLPSVYLSHSISDARRQVTGRRSKKTPFCDPDLGREFFKELNDFGRQLRKRFPVLEPTAIDEYRLADIPAELHIDQIKNHFLPFLTERWPLYDDDRLVPFTKEALVPELTPSQITLGYYSVPRVTSFMRSTRTLPRTWILRN